MAIVDTEEEFDWSAPFDRNATSVKHMRRIGDLQGVFERHGIRPVYAVGTPIAINPVAVAALQAILTEGRALLGAHLHPWVTPPLTEEVNERTSYPCNLPLALEAAKIRTLTEQIENAFGCRPLIYKAGRYGVRPQSFTILEALGYRVDISPMPPFDYRRQHGPDFSRRGNQPRWEGQGGRVLSIPNTGSFVGWAARPGLAWIGDIALSPAARRLHVSGILARLGLFERIALSPEGYTLAELSRLVRACLGRGQDLFVLCLHSPSVEPGHTPYVRNETDRTALLAKLDRFLKWFRAEVLGVPEDPLHLYAETMAIRWPAGFARIGKGTMSAPKQTISVRPIETADLPELAAFWCANLNPAISQPIWIDAFQRNWLPDPPNHGFRLLANGKLVGALGAIYSRQKIEGTEADFCNLTSLVVEDTYRARSMDLLSACLSQRQFAFTDFTPTPSVAKMLRLLRFHELRSGERLVISAPVPVRTTGLQAIERPEALARMLGEDAGKLWRDHQNLPWLRSFAVGREDKWCVVFWRRTVIKGLPGARILGFSDPVLFVRWHRAVGGHLLLRHGAIGMRIAEHLVPEGSVIGIRRPIAMPRLYRGPKIMHERVSFLYSEVVALPI